MDDIIFKIKEGHMKIDQIALLYINNLIRPLERMIKSPNFILKYSMEDQKAISQFLLQQYHNLEILINELK